MPQLFAVTGAEKWNDPKNHPWTMGWRPSHRIEARIYGRYILKNLPDSKIGVLYRNDDFGEDYLIATGTMQRRRRLASRNIGSLLTVSRLALIGQRTITPSTNPR